MTEHEQPPGVGSITSPRGQANLLSLVVALVLLSTALVASIAIVDAAFTTDQREATERAVATGASERLVAPDGPIADRENVLNKSRVTAFDDEALAAELPVASNRAIAVSLDDEQVAAVGQPDHGTTVRRVVLVESTESVERTPVLSTDRTTVPVRTERIELTIQPENTTVETVRVNDRVVLHDQEGLAGKYDIRTSRYETATLTFEGNGTLETGDIQLGYQVTTARKALLAVTVDERTGDWVDDDLVESRTEERSKRLAGGELP